MKSALEAKSKNKLNKLINFTYFDLESAVNSW